HPPTTFSLFPYTTLFRSRPAGEDVEDQPAAVDDLHADDLLEVAHLRGSEVVIEDHQRGAVVLRDRLDLFRFPLADERGRDQGDRDRKSTRLNSSHSQTSN